jgi:molybdopterin-guanine dinucleotide biosynthesis protein A
MGCDKGLLPFSGATLIERVASQVLEAAGNVAVVGRPADYAHLGLPVLGEDFPGCGPLSGIEASLRQMTAEWALVAACDMPGITADWLRHLIAIAGQSRCDAVVTAGADGRLEPLLAMYHAKLHGDVRKALTESRFAVRDVIAGWAVEFAETTDKGLVSNVNTPEEWSAWSR